MEQQRDSAEDTLLTAMIAVVVISGGAARTLICLDVVQEAVSLVGLGRARGTEAIGYLLMMCLSIPLMRPKT